LSTVTRASAPTCIVDTAPVEDQFNSDELGLESVLSEVSLFEGDIDMIGAQYITAEEAEEATEAQRRLKLAHVLGMTLGDKTVD